MEKFMGPIWAFGWALIFYLFHREKTKRRLHVFDLIHKERMQAIEKGLPYPELPPYAIEDEEEGDKHVHWKPVSPRRIAGVGVVVILGGAGALTALIISQDHYLQSLWSMGLIPIFLGVGLLLYAWINRKAETPQQ
ncbi:MAG: hypothetical protein JST93_18110 [Acidobacteria bacterium]|nr:hypothetical protein [Acidobacteriota bacterium]